MRKMILFVLLILTLSLLIDNKSRDFKEIVVEQRGSLWLK